MTALNFPLVRSLLCLGAHADDIEIGCGATLLGWLERQPDLEVTWVVFSASGTRRDEAAASAHAYLQRHPSAHVELLDFQDAYFPAQWQAIKDYFGQLARRIRPDLVFTHRLEDRHQDHRVVAELTWNAFRDTTILEYEVPKYEGDLGQPNLYQPVEARHAERKLELLPACFPSQAEKDWFDRETFAGLMRLRGLESRAPSRMAEAFHARKLTLGGG